MFQIPILFWFTQKNKNSIKKLTATKLSSEAWLKKNKKTRHSDIYKYTYQPDKPTVAKLSGEEA